MNKSAYNCCLLLLSISLSACTISPVNTDTLNATKSYADFEGISLVINKPAPVFSLPDADGKMVSLKDFNNSKPVLLLFYRGDWCAYCVDQLDNYQALLPELKRYNIQLIAISPDSVATIKHTQRKFGQDYIFLSDIDLEVIKKYGVGNNKDLPHPALFLIGIQGDLKWYYASTDHKVRPTAEQVEEIIREFYKK
jgi:peroxiredoxin